MKYVALYLTIACLCLGVFWSERVSAQDFARTQHTASERKAIKGKIYSDTLLFIRNYDKVYKKSERFYDTIHNSRSWFTRTLASFLVTSPRNSSDEAMPNPSLEFSRNYYSSFSGCQIVNINIVQANVFTRDPAQEPRGVEKFIDGLHRLTNAKVIERNLLFEVGDTVSPYRMSINEQLLRSLPYLATAYIVLTRSALNPNEVSVGIFARDNWTISVDGSWGSEYYGDLFDRNFLGTGDELRLRYYLPLGNQANGFEAQYRINNLFGTFMGVDIFAGVGASNNTARIEASRPFILPNDHIWGFEAGYEQRNSGMSTMDTTYNIRKIDYALWYGYSVMLDPSQGTAFYAMVGAAYHTFQKRPSVEFGVNPFYHNTFGAYMNLGVSRQNFYQGNMIYGYGRTEDIPFGFKCELVGGYQWSEFAGRRLYSGVSASWADMLGASYLNVGVEGGGYWTRERQWNQAFLDVSARYFSPLFKLGSLYLRQFVSASTTFGYDRFFGERESISYGSGADMRGMSPPYNCLGYNRAALNAETVFFTPLFFYHFRFAFYLWGDVGVLGYDKAIFNNPLSSVLGVGVRIKNERLIFNNIQLRFGIAICQPEHYDFSWFDISNEQHYEVPDFRPRVPSPLDYD